MHWPVLLLSPVLANAWQTPSRYPEVLSQEQETVMLPVCEPSAFCVSREDMGVLVKLLREKGCRQTEDPEFELDPIQIVVDKQGRVFFSGSDPRPYTLRMSWCNYDITAQGQVSVVAAMHEPPIWGFRFRPKAYVGILPTEAFYDGGHEFRDFVDAGFLIDFLYYDWMNLNAAVGFRSFGGGVGVDLTDNAGLAVTYALTWGQWRHNTLISLYFGF